MSESYKKFFKQHQSTLEHWYPGLRLDILERDLLGYPLDDLLQQKLLRGIPLAYITNQAAFYKSEFFVDERVLIPRSETEILIDEALSFLKGIKAGKIVDVGTGSGAIGLSLLFELKNFPVNNWHFQLLDLSDKALKVARLNYFQMVKRGEISPAHKIDFLQNDRLEGFAEESIQLILSNPPYIKFESDSGSVHPQVKLFEPQMALFLNDSEYEEWFRIFFAQIKKCLVIGGMAIIEGHEVHLKSLILLARAFNFCYAEIKQDYTKRDRFLILKK